MKKNTQVWGKTNLIGKTKSFEKKKNKTPLKKTNSFFLKKKQNPSKKKLP